MNPPALGPRKASRARRSATAPSWWLRGCTGSRGRLPDPGRAIIAGRGQSRPSGDQATERMNPACPVSVRSSRPPAASHTFAVPSALPVASRVPSGDQATERTWPACPARVRSPGRRPRPRLRRPVLTPRGQPAAVRRPGHGDDPPRMPLEREELLVRSRRPRPSPSRPWPPWPADCRPATRPREQTSLRVPVEREEFPAVGGVPDSAPCHPRSPSPAGGRPATTPRR